MDRWRQRRQRPPLDHALNDLSVEYSFEELYEATNGFSASKKIGHGAYGNVYRGTLRDGNEVAVKYLHGDTQAAGFEEEVKVLSKLRHQNLVILMGFSRHGDKRMLVYELLAGGDVGTRLHKGPSLTWKQRLNVALDAACGLSHLHNGSPKVYHRDIKSGNILLDRNGTAKWGDFGLAFFSAARAQKVLHAAGTIGYADPKYISTATVTEASEVYSFGWVLIELLTARPPAVQHMSGAVSYFFSKLKDSRTGRASLERLLNFTDPCGKFPPAVAAAVGRIALKCISSTESERPDFRALVLEIRKLVAQSDCLPCEGAPRETSARPIWASAAAPPAGLPRSPVPQPIIPEVPSVAVAPLKSTETGSEPGDPGGESNAKRPDPSSTNSSSSEDRRVAAIYRPPTPSLAEQALDRTIPLAAVFQRQPRYALAVGTTDTSSYHLSSDVPKVSATPLLRAQTTLPPQQFWGVPPEPHRMISPALDYQHNAPHHHQHHQQSLPPVIEAWNYRCSQPPYLEPPSGDIRRLKWIHTAPHSSRASVRSDSSTVVVRTTLGPPLCTKLDLPLEPPSVTPPTPRVGHESAFLVVKAQRQVPTSSDQQQPQDQQQDQQQQQQQQNVSGTPAPGGPAASSSLRSKLVPKLVDRSFRKVVTAQAPLASYSPPSTPRPQRKSPPPATAAYDALSSNRGEGAADSLTEKRVVLDRTYREPETAQRLVAEVEQQLAHAKSEEHQRRREHKKLVTLQQKEKLLQQLMYDPQSPRLRCDQSLAERIVVPPLKTPPTKLYNGVVPPKQRNGSRTGVRERSDPLPIAQSVFATPQQAPARTSSKPEKLNRRDTTEKTPRKHPLKNSTDESDVLVFSGCESLRKESPRHRRRDCVEIKQREESKIQQEEQKVEKARLDEKQELRRRKQLELKNKHPEGKKEKKSAVKSATAKKPNDNIATAVSTPRFSSSSTLSGFSSPPLTGVLRSAASVDPPDPLSAKLAAIKARLNETTAQKEAKNNPLMGGTESGIPWLSARQILLEVPPRKHRDRWRTPLLGSPNTLSRPVGAAV